MTNTQAPEFLTIAAAADRAGCHRQTIHRWFREELLTRYEDAAGHPRVKNSELEALLTPKPVKV
jgi:predicted site-specific integrase-resolvase